MKINGINVLITKLEGKTGKNNSNYLAINLIDLSSGNSFDIIERDIEVMRKLQPMNKYKMNFNLSANKYGMTLSIEKIMEHLGAI